MAVQRIPLDLPLSIEVIAQLNPYAVQLRYDDADIDYMTSTQAEIIIKGIRQWAEKYTQ